MDWDRTMVPGGILGYLHQAVPHTLSSSVLPFLIVPTSFWSLFSYMSPQFTCSSLWCLGFLSI